MWFFSSRKTRRTTTKPSHRPTFRPRVRALEDRCLMSAGMLDPTFNPTGTPPYEPPGTAALAKPYLSVPYNALVQPSGKIVLPGESSYTNGTWGLALAQFNANGSLDSGFGSGGVVTASKSAAPTVALGAALYPTGSGGDLKIVVVGPGSSSTFALARYNANGSLDASFGKSGFANTSFTQGTGASSTVGVSARDSVVLVPNGTSLPKIVVAGSDANNAGVELVRYNPDGSLDTSFGTKGTAYRAIPGGIMLGALALDSASGDLIVVGQNGPLVAFQSNGSLDTAFGTNGLVTGAEGTGLAIYPATDTTGNAGKILVGVSGGIGRYNANGTLDTSWSGTGVETAVTELGLAIQQDGKVLAASGNWGVARLNTDGSLDHSFGTGGVTTVGLRGTALYYDYGVTLQPNGDILEFGTSWATVGNTTYGNVFAVARFLPSEPEIGSFTANQVMASGPVTLTASNISDGNPNSTISQVSFFYYDGSGNKIVVGTATAPDGAGNWTLSVGLPPGSYTLYAQATDRYGVLGDPLAYSMAVQ